MTIVGSTGSAFYSDGDQALTIGTPYRAIVTATIDGSTRSFPATVLAVDTSAAANIAQSVWRRTGSQLVADGTAGGAGSAAEVMNEVISDVAGVGTLVSAVDTVVDAILVDTGTTLPATLATIDGIADAILVDTGTTLPATLATIDGIADAILVDTGTTLPDQVTALNDPTVGAIADAVWGEQLSAHSGAGSAGKAVSDAATDASSASSSASAASSGVSALNDPTAATVATAVRSELATELARIDAATSSRSAPGAAMTLTSGERDAIAAALLDLSNGVESSVTMRQALRLMAAGLAGQAAGLGTTNVTFAAANNSGTNRITSTVDTDGNRSSVTLSL